MNDETLKRILVKYVNDQLRPGNVLGITNRTMLLLCEGANALRAICRKGH